MVVFKALFFCIKIPLVFRAWALFRPSLKLRQNYQLYSLSAIYTALQQLTQNLCPFLLSGLHWSLHIRVFLSSLPWSLSSAYPPEDAPTTGYARAFFVLLCGILDLVLLCMSATILHFPLLDIIVC